MGYPPPDPLFKTTVEQSCCLKLPLSKKYAHFPTLPLIMQVVTPPHSLEELLAVMAVKDEITVGSVDQVCDVCS